MKSRLEDFKVVRKVRAINLAVQIFLGLTLFLALNFLAARHFFKYDLSENRQNSLSPESAAFVKKLEAPVEIFVTLTKSSQDPKSIETYAQVSSLLRRYEYEATGGGAGVKLTFVDPHFDGRLAERLAERFGKDMENCVIIACNNHFKKLKAADLYDIDADSNRSFKGEQVVSSAIINVSSEKVKKVYFLKGHGEMSYKNTDQRRGLSEFANYLTQQNYQIAELDLSDAKQVPEDAGLLIIASPQAPFLPRELDAIRKYLFNDNGRAAIFLDMGSLYGLESVLFEWGILSDDMLVLDNSGDYESSDGDLIARHFPQNPHPVVRYLLDAQLPVQFGSVRPVREDLGAPADDRLKLSPIILSSATSWAEKSYARGGAQVYEEAADLRGPIPLGMVASRSGGTDLGLTIPGGRVAVFGDDNFLANRWFNRLGNSKLALNLVNWMFDENVMLNIPPRRVEKYTLTLSNGDIRQLGLKFLILPAFVFLTGLIVYFVRR